MPGLVIEIIGVGEENLTAYYSYFFLNHTFSILLRTYYLNILLWNYEYFSYQLTNSTTAKTLASNGH